MSHDREWGTWQEDWKVQIGPEPARHSLDLRRRVKRETMKMTLCLMTEVVLSVSFLLYCVWRLLRFPEPSSVVLLVAAIIFVAAAQGFSIAVKRGQWQPVDRTARSFLDLSRQRCRTTLKSLRFAWQLLVAEYLFLTAWGILRFGELQREARLMRYLLVYSLAALFGVGLWIWTVRKRKRTERELETLDAIEKEMES